MISRGDEIDAAALTLLDEAWGAPPESRRSFILEKTGADPALRDRALALLDAENDPDGAPLTGGGLRLLDEGFVPDVIGNYRIEREIGRGGMGAVYLARRIAGDFDHVAAIKIVRLTGRPKVFSERLRAERRMLAQLQHPNIAQLYDGGETGDGSPYFIMEYVEGSSLHDYLRTHRALLPERLKIFSEICRAIAYAHRNLVVHRDLSPANVLISNDGQAKLIDFGISHMIGEDADESGPRLTMTKGYAAPERQRGETTTLGDIYSLGVILGELTAGEKAPRVRDLAAVAARARAEKPEARYQNVEALLDDLARYEQARAVAAIDGGWRYKTLRFVARRKLAVSAASLAAVGVLATSVVTTILYLRAEEAERQAVEQFEAVRSLAKFMLFDLHDEIASIPGSTRAREMLADTGQRYLDALSRTDDASRALRMETALGYKRLGDVLGNANGGNLGRRSEAGAVLEKAYAELAALKQEAPKDTEIVRAFAETAYALAVYNFVIADKVDAAVEKAAESEQAYRAIAAGPNGAVRDQIGIAEAQSEQAIALVWMNKGEEAIPLLEDAAARIDMLLEADPAEDAALRARAQAAVDLGDTMSRHVDQRGGDQAPALAHLDDGVARFRTLLSSDGADLDLKRSYIAALWKRALVLYALERDEASLADLAEADALLAPLMTSDPDDLGLFRMRLSILSQQAMSFGYLGRNGEAIAKSEENIAGRRRLAAMEPDNSALKRETAAALLTLGESRERNGDFAAACADYEEANTWLDGLRGDPETNAYYESMSGAALEQHLAQCREPAGAGAGGDDL